jgi:hypothetical protein
MTLLAHAQENQVQYRLTTRVRGGKSAELRFSLRGGLPRRVLSMHSMYLICRNA